VRDGRVLKERKMGICACSVYLLGLDDAGFCGRELLSQLVMLRWCQRQRRARW
jgi:hypothetical protein